MPRLRILLLGATGGLGQALGRHLAADHEVISLRRTDLDLEQPEGIAAKLSRHSFDVLLNPAGMTSPDLCEAQPERAQLANVNGPQALAEFCHARGVRMIHYSTDYVFSGESCDLTEDAPAEPINTYGRTKREGELAVLKASPDALITRVSWLFGPDKPSHPDHMIQRAVQSADLTAVVDKVSAPTSTTDLSGWTARLLANHPNVNGVLHLANSGVASWHSWGEHALKWAGDKLGLPLKTTSIRPIKLADLTLLKAPRPLMTLMNIERLQNLMGFEIRHWMFALEDYLTEKYQTK